MRILIFGRNGWLAGKFKEFFPNSEISSADITDFNEVNAALEDKKPDVVINAAGKTGRPNIDWCENNKLKTMCSNVMGPKNLFHLCKTKKIFLVHLSSGCVFQGFGPNGKGFKEKDEARPPSWYSLTKYRADMCLEKGWVLIPRLRLPIDGQSHPRNLIDKLVKYRQVINDQNSITVVSDFCHAVSKLIKKERTGIYHVVNPDTISPAEIMQLYREIVDAKHHFQVITDDDLYRHGLAVARRSNCFLNTCKLEREGIFLIPIKQRIRMVLEEYKKNLTHCH